MAPLRFNPFTNNFEEQGRNEGALLAYVNNRLNDIVGTSPADLDTLRELSDALAADAQFFSRVAQVSGDLATLSGEVAAINSTSPAAVAAVSGFLASKISTTSGSLTTLVSTTSGALAATIAANAAEAGTLQYALDKAMTGADFYIDVVTVGTPATATYTFGLSQSGLGSTITG